ncbi:MAG TPA: hypothetical protein VHK65_08665 [Candidatus Dormibacteraeota bacterium]|nr:hypothetical protein [Candidatus Dormibacteraeota bacterium]
MKIIRNIRQSKLRNISPLIAPVVLIVFGLAVQNTAIWIIGVVLIPPSLGAANRLRR